MTGIAITSEELSVWARYIHDLCGVVLDHTKGYLLETRLNDLLEETGSSSFSELYYKAKADITNGIRRKIIDSITTNETSFFRDTSPFELLQHKILPELIDRRRHAGNKVIPIRIWSAACSTGQEAFSTAIILKELLMDLRPYDIRILGTDISNQAVSKASYGLFTQLELSRGMSPDKIIKYFVPHGEQWKIRDEIRAMVSFRLMNLLEPFSFPSPFDIVMCRNVAIYFTEQDKKKLFSSIGKHLAPDGALIIGSTESITGLCPEYEPRRYLRSVFYQIKKVS